MQTSLFGAASFGKLKYRNTPCSGEVLIIHDLLHDDDHFRFHIHGAAKHLENKDISSHWSICSLYAKSLILRILLEILIFIQKKRLKTLFFV
jgi:hypothetical protein